MYPFTPTAQTQPHHAVKREGEKNRQKKDSSKQPVNHHQPPYTSNSLPKGYLYQIEN